MMGWAVNSMAKAVEGSIPFLPTLAQKVKSLIAKKELNLMVKYVPFNHSNMSSNLIALKSALSTVNNHNK